MTCSEVMTANPSCCVPSDSVAMAAQIMKREDIGPVLVVSDYYSQNLVGIVTDRDLAVKVIAEGRDPHNTRIDEVMSLNPVTCRTNDDAYKALRLMSENQVRRIPVVDSGNRLVGIVAQGDLARRLDEEDVGEMVEEISQPYGSAPWEIASERGAHGERQEYAGVHNGSHHASSSTASSLAVGAVCLGVGAGMMYLFDPNRGRTRRAIARDKAASWCNASSEIVARTAEDLRNRATGIATGTKSLLKSEPVSNEKLVERVRSKMGRYVSRPDAIQVDADNGHVRLRGSIFADEVDKLLQCVKGIAGIASVGNQLDVQDMRSPSMEPRTGEQWDFMKKNWSPTTRVMASAVGGGLLLYGIKSRTNIGRATATVGLGLLTRGIANREMADIKGISKLRKLVEEKALPQLH
jgi:CBS domain-containing protein/osmotically-inducible protein OsmY